MTTFMLANRAKSPKWIIRGVVAFNFVLLLAMAIPPLNTPRAMSAIRVSGLDPWLAVAIPSWLVLSTLAATILFVYPLARKSANCQSGDLRLDGWFLLVWWIALVLLILYGLGLGSGG